jgi:hypothetical protein
MRWSESVAGRPVLFSVARPTDVGSEAISPADPMTQLVQCVEDLEWQARSWCAAGSSAATAIYRPSTSLRTKSSGAPRARNLD